MNIDALVPKPSHCEPFKRSKERFVPEKTGCYVLTTFSKVVLYIGLAHNLRRRINDHLDNPLKTSETKVGRAVLFHWLETPDINKVERTWMNIHIQNEGALPLLNRVYSPVST
jgi:predicted GIY-YIG superfamily endonuclease